MISFILLNNREFLGMGRSPDCFTLSLALTTTALSTGARLGNVVGDELDELFVSDISDIASLATADEDIGGGAGALRFFMTEDSEPFELLETYYQDDKSRVTKTTANVSLFFSFKSKLPASDWK